MKIGDWHVIFLDEVESTNDEAIRYSQNADGKNYVITAKRQTKGRGRRGRSWICLSGNLFFSMLFKYDITKAGDLAVICSLSLLQCIKKISNTANVCLKWPNDVLLNAAKVSGILLESAGNNYVVAGIGVNIAQSPKNNELLYPVTSLREAGIKKEAADFLKLYLEVFTANYNQCIQEGGEKLRKTWLDNAVGIDEKIAVCQNGKDIIGIFRGIDENGALLLERDGEVSKILAGDVFYEGRKNDGI